MNKLVFISIFMLFFSSLYSQNISGKIVDSLNVVILYTNIGIKGQNIGTISDQNDDFSLNLMNLKQDFKIFVTTQVFQTCF